MVLMELVLQLLPATILAPVQLVSCHARRGHIHRKAPVFVQLPLLATILRVTQAAKYVAPLAQNA